MPDELVEFSLSIFVALYHPPDHPAVSVSKIAGFRTHWWNSGGQFANSGVENTTLEIQPIEIHKVGVERIRSDIVLSFCGLSVSLQIVHRSLSILIGFLKRWRLYRNMRIVWLRNETRAMFLLILSRHSQFEKPIVEKVRPASPGSGWRAVYWRLCILKREIHGLPAWQCSWKSGVVYWSYWIFDEWTCLMMIQDTSAVTIAFDMWISVYCTWIAVQNECYQESARPLIDSCKPSHGHNRRSWFWILSNDICWSYLHTHRLNKHALCRLYSRGTSHPIRNTAGPEKARANGRRIRILHFGETPQLKS